MGVRVSDRCVAGVQADVYSFGVMLWEIVTTIAPVRGGMTEVSAPQDCPQTIADLIQVLPLAPLTTAYTLLPADVPRTHPSNSLAYRTLSMQ